MRRDHVHSNLSVLLSHMLAAFATSAVLLVSGCGMGRTDTQTSPSGPLSISGKIVGGENPISGATVSFYETTSNGVAATGLYKGYYAPATPLTALESTLSNASGSFPFSTALACVRSTDYVYATAAGGNSGANANNPQILLAAAVGSCSNFGASTSIVINELTTVAAAYALQGFSSVTGTYTAGSPATVPVLSVTSSTTNYATASATAGSLSAAGLAHAFANAANLVNVTTGAPYSSIPSNAGTVAPLSLINMLGNILQACVNSTGGSATSSTANDGSGCGKLFSYTTVNSVVPTNTLSALLNIVRNPTASVTNLFNLASTSGAFAPTVTQAPADLSMAIVYSKFDGASNGDTSDSQTNGLYYPYSLTLDDNDNVYVLNTNGVPTTQSNVLAFSSSGTPLYSTAIDSTVSTAPRYIAADGVGNIFTVSGSTIAEFTAATGAAEQTITLPNSATGLQSIAIDSSNNLWVGVTETGTAT